MRTVITKTLKKYRSELILAIASVLLLFWNILHIPFIDPDSYLWLDKVRHIFINNSWTTYPLHFGKPPVFIWLEALSVKILGWHWLAITLPHQIISLLYVLITYLIGGKLFNRKTAVWGAWITLSCVNFFHLRFSYNVDVLMATTMLASLYFYLRFRKSYALSDLLWVYGFCFLGWYTKSIYGFLIFGIAVLMEFKNRKFWKTILKFWKQQLALIAALLLIMVPWFLGQYHIHGQKFIQSMLGDQIGRLFYQQGNPQLPPNHQFLDYVMFIYLFMLPWSTALFHTLKNYWDNFRSNRELQILGLWVAIPLIVFSLSSELKIPRYILFIYPIFGILLANTILQFEKLKPKNDRKGLNVLSLLLGMVVALILGLMIAVSFKDGSISTQRHIPLLAPYLISMVVAILGATFLVVFNKKNYLSRVAAFSLISLVLLTFSAQSFINKPYPRLAAAQEIEKFLPPSTSLALYNVPALNELNFSNYRHVENLKADSLHNFNYLVVAESPEQSSQRVRGQRLKSVSLDYYNGHSRKFENWVYRLYQLEH
jgi:4-amino-4-deoxy-L-arabinose transferase-like glycosyltransferase